MAGRNLTLYTGVVLGVRRTGVVDQPRLGDDVTIYARAKVLGGISIGDGVTIGANAVVVEDVPAGCLIGGILARMVRTALYRESGVKPDAGDDPAAKRQTG